MRGLALMWVGADRKASSDLVQRPQTTGAHVHPAHLTIDLHSGTLDVGFELAIRRPFGVANVVPKPRSFATHFTFGHFSTTSTMIRSGGYDTTTWAFAQTCWSRREHAI